MIFAYWMILAVALVPYAAASYAKAGGTDNHAPRLYAETLTGARRRADWAQRNHHEVFPLFAAAVIIDGMTGVAHATMNWLSAGFLILRILYTLAYVTDRASLRTFLFILGAGCIVGLFVAAGLA